MTKDCLRCGLPKEHGPNRARRDGLQTYCRDCMRGIHTTARVTNPAQSRAWSKAWRDRIRAEALAAYGGRCACCGEDEPLFLALDHIEYLDPGHVRANGKRLASEKVLADLKRRGWPKDNYRLLCHNCNTGREFNGGVCPHEAKRLRVVA